MRKLIVVCLAVFVISVWASAVPGAVDLVIDPDSIVLSEKSPVEGDAVTISAVLRNQGDMDITEDVEVRFVEGDPEKGGLQIGSDAIALGIKAGATGKMQVKWRVAAGKTKIYVIADPHDMVKETKRWATDLDEWGTREGTKEVTITDVSIFDKWGRKTYKIKSGGKITIRVNFIVEEEIDDFHFGVAIFREDGVYCYGPNTQFDGLVIKRMDRGKGYFELECKNLLLMPRSYYVSVAIWDNNETLAYDYHKCSYKIEIMRNSTFGQLLRLSSKWSNSKLSLSSNIKYLPNLDYLTEKVGTEVNSDLIIFESLVFLNNYDCKDNVFVTGRDFKIKVAFKIDKSLNKQLKFYILWIGIYRSDGIYCHGETKKVSFCGTNSETLIYPKLRLLPGGYKVSAGIWASDTHRFLAYSHGIHSFNMISNKRDHGTVYLEHRWSWHIPKGGIAQCQTKNLL